MLEVRNGALLTLSAAWRKASSPPGATDAVERDLVALGFVCAATGPDPKATVLPFLKLSTRPPAAAPLLFFF